MRYVSQDSQDFADIVVSPFRPERQKTESACGERDAIWAAGAVCICALLELLMRGKAENTILFILLILSKGLANVDTPEFLVNCPS